MDIVALQINVEAQSTDYTSSVYCC